jgi:hypothetical protein
MSSDFSKDELRVQRREAHRRPVLREGRVLVGEGAIPSTTPCGTGVRRRQDTRRGRSRSAGHAGPVDCSRRTRLPLHSGVEKGGLGRAHICEWPS